MFSVMCFEENLTIIITITNSYATMAAKHTLSLRTQTNQCIKSLLSSCKSLQQALQIHAHMIVTGHHNNLFLSTTLFTFYATSTSSQSLHHSHTLFSQITNPDLFLWNAIIKAYSLTLHSPPKHPFSLFKSMLSCSISPDSFTFPYLFKSCANLLVTDNSPKMGLQVHCHVVRNGYGSDVYVNNGMLNFYCAFGGVDDAYKVFGEIPVRNCVSFNTMINGFVRAGFVKCCFRVFEEMRGACVKPDEYTFVGLLSCCSLLENYRIGREVHGLVYRELGCFGGSVLLVNKLVDMYAKCGCLVMAERVVTVSGMKIGMGVVPAWTSLVSAYALRREVEVARRLFDRMGERDVVSWTAMISGYSHAGCFREALELFVKMEGFGLKPDEVAVVAALSACARLGSLELGRRIHHQYAGENWTCGLNGGFISAVVDMYAKCGSIDAALDVFRKISDDVKTTILYNSIISGLAHHGLGEHALTLFEEMGLLGLKPDKITFIAVLSACGHCGLVDVGKKLFESMLTVYGVNPEMEHYGCIVDLLGRAGRLDEAHRLVLKMPFKANAVIWRALLSACKVHGDVAFARLASYELLELERDHGASYVMLSNMLADMDQHDEAAGLRKAIDNVAIQKPSGLSYMELNGTLHKFVAGDKSHTEAKTAEVVLGEINLGLNSE
ncbi:pentatricopeptide repeat-containing protein At5g56310-like [Vicia villosa]|uniref:pentatricopeptide repeat-containing protein At5g56310-like n=1 Tax=Vicia villosa TaxID=3911 RepID=UPI00273CA15E|nr:pentatricopeptide repeat-containing protein At5g56310-like [Vicia villosa]XP_058775169.1 pentatricopeptide repeat-containing protein At5g56310-like [Vicia villosa]XP_058775170.1 pentatricopeptide repeat-containing protein At5g56310-like [Vicia villosa]